MLHHISWKSGDQKKSEKKRSPEVRASPELMLKRSLHKWQDFPLDCNEGNESSQEANPDSGMGDRIFLRDMSIYSSTASHDIY